jgi:hypothetical protein
MNRSEVRDLFDRALPEQPVAGRITRESAVLAGRMARRRRLQARVAVVVAAFCAVVLGLAVPSFVTGGNGRGLGPATPSLSATFAPTGPASATSSPPATPSPVAQVSTRPGNLADMSAALLTKARQLVPDATFTPVTVGFDDGNRELAPFVLTDNQHGYYIAMAQITAPAAVGTLSLSMWARPDDRKSPTPGCENIYQPQLRCDNVTGPAGEEIWITTGYYTGTTTLEYMVKVFRADGTIMRCTLTNQAANQAQSPTPGPHGTTPPMAAEQLVELLTIPGLSLGS